VPVPEPTTDAIRASIEEGGDSDTAHVMYVWVDALANYLSAIGWPNGDLYKKFWEAPKGGGGSDDVDATESGGGEVVHLVGKDILRFHAVYWPALLMAAGITPPARLFAHGWWTRDGAKISKSVGNVIDPKDLVETFGVDQVGREVGR
jgi:methionyl-tRNA synthetase